MQLSLTEEDYLKAIYHLSAPDFAQGVSTNDIAKRIDLSAASVSDMLKKLSQKNLINYIKYQGVTLTEQGKAHAIYTIRKHRLWETFLVEKLKFSWDEVHEIAEQLEHIQSPLLVQKLDEFLNFPAYDPHGDPIPNEKGEIAPQKRIVLKDAPRFEILKVIAVEQHSQAFLKYLNKIKINIGTVLEVIERIEYDGSLEIRIDKHRELIISSEAANNIYVSKLEIIG
jgi:DtxR family transcriptional regulator, Mn-dependent transcriptional regulator